MQLPISSQVKARSCSHAAKIMAWTASVSKMASCGVSESVCRKSSLTASLPTTPCKTFNVTATWRAPENKFWSPSSCGRLDTIKGGSLTLSGSLDLKGLDNSTSGVTAGMGTSGEASTVRTRSGSWARLRLSVRSHTIILVSWGHLSRAFTASSWFCNSMIAQIWEQLQAPRLATWSRKASRSSLLPSMSAKERGVRPLESTANISAFSFRSSCATSLWSKRIAKQRGVGLW